MTERRISPYSLHSLIFHIVSLQYIVLGKNAPLLFRKSLSRTEIKTSRTIRRRFYKQGHKSQPFSWNAEGLLTWCPAGASMEGGVIGTTVVFLVFDVSSRLMHLAARSHRSSNSWRELWYGSSSSSSNSASICSARFRLSRRPLGFIRKSNQTSRKTSGPQLSRIWKRTRCARWHVLSSSFRSNDRYFGWGRSKRSSRTKMMYLFQRDLYTYHDTSCVTDGQETYCEGWRLDATTFSMISMAASSSQIDRLLAII